MPLFRRTLIVIPNTAPEPSVTGGTDAAEQPPRPADTRDIRATACNLLEHLAELEDEGESHAQTLADLAALAPLACEVMYIPDDDATVTAVTATARNALAAASQIPSTLIPLLTDEQLEAHLAAATPRQRRTWLRYACTLLGFPDPGH